MSEDDPLTIDCESCAAAGTSACNECVVGHVLANDDGPIGLVVAPRRRPAPTARAVDLFRRAGLLDDPPVLVPIEEFDDALPAAVRSHPSAARGPRTTR